MKVSEKSWKVTATLFHLLGILGAHRFYVEKIGTGILWFFTGGLFGLGALMDLIMLYTGNFTDADGALVIPEYKKLLLQTIRQGRGPAQFIPANAAPAWAPVPTASIPAQEPQGANSAELRAAFPEAVSSGVIKMTHISPDAADQLRAVREYVAMGFHFEEDRIDALVLYKVKSGEIQQSFLYDERTVKAQDFADFIGARATLVCYGLRAGFRAFGAVLKDVTASADWDYVDLQELPEKDGVRFEQATTALDRARNAIEYFEAWRKL